MQFRFNGSSLLRVASPRRQTLYIVAKVLISFAKNQEIYKENRTVGTILNKRTFGKASMKESCCKV
jgi:hypothetical protein